MVSSAGSWLKEFNEAVKLADDISNMIPERGEFPALGRERQRHDSSIRRKITILRTRLDGLPSIQANISRKQPISEKEMNRLKDMLSSLTVRVEGMACTMNMLNFGNGNSLLGPEAKTADAMSQIAHFDNQGIVGLQRKILREEQDEDLEKLEETVTSTKHVALAIDGELDLHMRLIDAVDQHVDVTESNIMRLQKRLRVLNKHVRGECTCFAMLISVIGIVVLVLTIYLLIKYL